MNNKEVLQSVGRQYMRRSRLQREALDAIYARVQGIYDDPTLVELLGDLTPSTDQDILRILEVTEERIREI